MIRTAKIGQKAYFVGIKGVAMTAMAVLLKEKGYTVSGVDVPDQFFTDKILAEKNIPVLTNFDPRHIIKDKSLVIVTGAHGGATNPEAKKAKKLGIPTFMHGRYLGILMDEKLGIAVAGCHGKTTTSAMIAWTLKRAGLDPSYAIGTAYINDLGPAGHFGRGKYFIAEADEYMTCPLTDSTPRFCYLHPQIAVITNIDYDHPDSYSDLEAVKDAYISFSEKIRPDGLLIACIDDQAVSSVIDRFRSPRILTYGFSSRADYRIENYQKNGSSATFTVVHQKITFPKLEVNVAGKHNALNALAAAIACHQAGLSWSVISDKLKDFRGSNRRFEKIFTDDGISLFDDYAHHPREIKATISAFRSAYPESKLLIIFQPHTFSRTKRLLPDFVSCFIDCDQVFLADIFPSAREKLDTSINSSILADKINLVSNNCLYVQDEKVLLRQLKKYLSKETVLVTMGAGDLYRWHKPIIKFLKENVSSI